ncbi:PREDICTED: uncharacterized protein LOC107355996 [Acropora digitifera]|uniref:uncharacterized protein LOC107355996 n=1 Tax=Acropora digitifera TaxID=70779 RepID=UPI00077ABF58|nr:PREDICTED: uncharacterized protein LOC107355996 [Acropora digitifera]
MITTIVVWMLVECIVSCFKPRLHRVSMRSPSAILPAVVQTDVKKVTDRKAAFMRRPKRKLLNTLEKAGFDRIQSMIAAQERGLRRLRRGRERALETARVLHKIRRREALEFAESSDESRRVFSELQELQRMKERELREWVRNITKSCEEPTAENDEFEKLVSEDGTELDPVCRSTTETAVQSPAGALGDVEKAEQVCKGIGHDSEVSDDLTQNTRESNHDTDTVGAVASCTKQGHVNDEAEGHADWPTNQIYATLSDNTTFKMTLGKRNKLAKLLPKSFSDDGFYVDL